MKLECGINENIFELLKEKVQHFPEHEKIVNLSLDEMSLMCNMSYNDCSDYVIGFEVLGDARTGKLIVTHFNVLESKNAISF